MPAAGGRAARIGGVAARLDIGGRSWDVPISHVWTVRDGLAVRAEFYIDNPTMLAALT